MLFFCWRLQRRERWVYIYTPLLLHNARAQVKGTKEVYLASRRCSLILVFSKQNSVVVVFQMADKHSTWPHQSMKTRLAQRTFAIQFAFSSIWWSHSVLVEMLFFCWWRAISYLFRREKLLRSRHTTQEMPLGSPVIATFCHSPRLCRV